MKTKLINITLPKEKDARLEFSGTKTPQKNLYLKLYVVVKEPWKLGNAKTTNLSPTKW